MHDSGRTIHRYKGDGSFDKFVKTSDRGVRFQLMGTVSKIHSSKPISVRMFNESCVRFRSVADLVEETEDIHETFWDVLKDGGGDWMWEFVDDKYKGGDMAWLREGMEDGMLV